MSDKWLPIDAAAKEVGVEIIGTRWAFREDGKAVCIQEPFISFWSPSLNKFYCSPTHWIPAPRAPERPIHPIARCMMDLHDRTVAGLEGK